MKKAGNGENLDIVVWNEDGLGHIGISTTKTFREEIKNFVELVKH